MSKTNLISALSVPDTGIDPPSKRNPNSLTSLIASLRVGECASRVEALDSNMSVRDMALTVGEIKSTLRNNVAPSVRNARQRVAGSEFTVEVAELVTPAGSLYVVAIITRTL